MPNKARLELDPRTKLLLLAVVSWLSLYASSTFKLLVLSAVSLAVPLLSRIGIKKTFRSLWPLAVLILIFSLAGAILDSRPPWYELGPIRISRPGIITSLLVSLRVVIILWWAVWFTSSTSVRSMTMALEWLLSPLNRLGINTSALILTLVVALRFIPELLAEGQLIREAQQLKGYRDQSGRVTAAARNLLVMLLPLLARTWLRAEDLADAICARGYRTGQIPVRLQALTITAQDIGALLVMTVLTGWIITS